MDKIRLSILMLLILFASPERLFSQQLKVNANHRYLELDSKPFFWLGDTAWELFHRLNREEADLYLNDRASKGFNVIQAVVLAELDGLRTPNAYGELPLIDLDPARPNEKYLEHVDYIIEKANSLGMFIGLLPTWGDKFNKKWGEGPEVFTPENAVKFGDFLAKRYKDKQVIWILGGDRNPEREEHFEIIRAIAKGIRDVHQGAQLMTYHPMGGTTTADIFPDDDWLDFHTFQSGHGARDGPNYKYNIKNIKVAPQKPTIDSEPRYEDHPVDWKPDTLGWFDDFDVRQAAYWSMLSGAAGHTYGNHNIWQMWEAGREPISWARTGWQQSLNHIGAAQMGYMKKLFEEMPWHQLIPDQSLIDNENPEGTSYQKAALSIDKTYALIYTPNGKALSIDLKKMQGDFLCARWFNPRDAQSIPIDCFKNMDTVLFTPPASGRGSDWILIVDNKEQF